MIPTLNDFGQLAYSDEEKEQEIMEKYFQKVNIKMLNKETMEMKRNYFEVADVVGRVFIGYLAEKNIKLSKVYNKMSPSWEKYGIKFDRNYFGNLLRDVYKKGRCNNMAKIVILSTVIDTAFNHETIYKHAIARMMVDGQTDLISTFHSMQDELRKWQNAAAMTNYRYMKPQKLSEIKARIKHYRKGSMKNLPRRGYDNGSYEWDENEP